MIGFGIFFICLIMLVFTVTHMLKFDTERSSIEVAGELCLILLGSFFLYMVLYLMRGVL